MNDTEHVGGAGAPGELPLELTRFIGRRKELAIARSAFERARLVTLTGTGGVGKTRLAFQLAKEVSRAFDEDVRVVALADLQDPGLLGHTVNAAVGIRETSARWQPETLIEYLGDRHVLMVLDNCEHLIEEAAGLAGLLLRSCPRLWILATSRQALNIDGEVAVPVPPLSVSDGGHWGNRAVAADSEAVSLFLDRAVSVDPEFALTSETEPQVVELCRLLDGIPLAIELAAVRLRVLPLRDLTARMGDRYRLLTQGSRSAPARHQTLRACIDWTFELCSPAERTLWSRLSVFAGGFGLDAAEAIGAGGSIAPESVLDLVAGLVDKSIVSRVMDAGEPRYQMLETIRQYGMDKLDATEAEELDRRHHRWYVELAERADLDWSGPRQTEWLERLRWEHANLRAALNSCLTADPCAGLRLVYSIENYWLASGFLAEARQWLDRLTEAAGEPVVERGRGLRLNAWLAILQGDHELVPPLLEEAGQIAAATGDALLTAFVDQTWGLLALFRSDFQVAVQRLEEAVERFAVLGHRTAEFHSMFEVGLALSLAGDGERAADWHRRCSQTTTTIGESWWRSFSLWAYGIEKLRQGDTAEAARLEREALQLKRRLDDQLGIAVVLEAMSWIVASEGEMDRAARLLGAADALLRTVGMALDSIPRLWMFHSQGEDAMRSRGTERAFRSAWSAGAQMSTAAAVALALNESDDRRRPPQHLAEAAEQHGQETLTKREHEISTLVAQGLTNREIASRLVISVRTAEKHVDHIMSKLGFANRTQIAAWVADMRNAG